MSYTPRSLFRLLEEIQANRLLLPHIQRPFVWDKEQMSRLFDSLMREYPIQTLLFWRTSMAIRARRFMPVVDPDADLSDLYDLPASKEGVPKVFVLDGQQRLQTLFAVFKGAIRDEDGLVAEAYCNVIEGDEFVDSTDQLFNLTFSNVPLQLPMLRIRDLAESFSTQNALLIADELNDKLEPLLTETETQRKARERRVRATLQQLDSILNHDKHFWVDELDGIARQYPYKRILDIFVRVNTGGTKLTAGDLMFAAMKEGWEDFELCVDHTVDLLSGGKLTFDHGFVLKCLLLAHGRGSEVRPEKFFGADGEALLSSIESSWPRAEAAFSILRDLIVHELRLVSDKQIRSTNALVPLFVYLFHTPQPNPQQRRQMTAYYHKAQLFGWYAYQTDGVLNALNQIVSSPPPDRFPLTEIKAHFAARSLQTVLSESILEDRRARGLLLNIVYAEKWGASPFDVAFRGNDPHVDHIFPQYMLRSRLSSSSSEINDIGNLRYVGATDNIRKRAELPAQYFGRLKEAGVPIEKHLLVERYAEDPNQLLFSGIGFSEFRAARRTAIWRILRSAVDPEEGATTP